MPALCVMAACRGISCRVDLLCTPAGSFKGLLLQARVCVLGHVSHDQPDPLMPG